MADPPGPPYRQPDRKMFVFLTTSLSEPNEMDDMLVSFDLTIKVSNKRVSNHPMPTDYESP